MSFIPNWEPEEDIKNMSRRGLLKWWLKFWAWLWIAWLVWWVLSWDKEAVASISNNIEKPAHISDDVVIDMTWKLEKWDKEGFEKALENISLDDRQVVLDFVLTWVFFWKIIPKFLSWDIPDAMAITIPAVSIWYALSTHESQHHFMAEMEEAWISVIQMMAIVSAIEWVNINIENLIQSKVSEKFDVEISELSSPIWNVWKKLDKLWITVFSSEDENEEETRSVSVRNWKVVISKEVFLEILPYVISWKNLEWILSKISSYSTKIDFKEVKHIIDESIERNWFWEIDESEYQKQQELKFLWEVFMYEISLLISFVLTNQLIFWLWQTTLIKDKITELWLRLELLALNSWLPWDEARNLSKKFVNLSISYLPNRMAWTSDLWPFMAALSKWWWMWIAKMIDWVAPVVMANISPYLNWVDEILCSSLWTDSNIWNWFLKTFFSNLIPNLHLHWKLVLHAWKTVLDTAWLVWEKFSWKDFSFTSEELWVRKRNFPFVINSKKLEKVLDYPVEVVNLDDDEMVKALEECDYFLSQDTDISADYRNSKFWIKNISYLLFVLEQVYNRWTEEHKDKVNAIFRKHISKIRNLAEWISWLSSHSRKWLLLATSSRILSFVSIFVDFKNEAHESWEPKNIFFEEVYSYISDSWNGLSWLDFSGSWLYVEDLELCFKESTYKYWNLKSISKIIWNNLDFLMFVKWKDETLYKKLRNIFITNILNIEDWSKKTWWLSIYSSMISWSLVYLSSNASLDTIKFFEDEVLSDERTASIKESYKKILLAREQYWASNDNWDTENESLDWKENIFWKVFNSFSGALWKWIHWAEHTLWKNSFEVMQMIFMIQTPYVLAVKDTIARVIKQLPSNTPDSVKEFFIGLWTYVISMFADNYVWLVVWIELAKDLLWMDSDTAIEKFSKHAIYWWSKVVTWNSPNALFDAGLRDDFYFHENFTPSNDNKDFGVLNQIDWKLRALKNSKSKKWFDKRKKELRKLILNNDLKFWRWYVTSILSDLDNISYWEYSSINGFRSKVLHGLLAKMTSNNHEWVISQLWKLWFNILEVMLDVASLQLMPSLTWLVNNVANWNTISLAWNVWWTFLQSIWVWKAMDSIRKGVWKLVA